jgi:hypothetical protein
MFFDLRLVRHLKLRITLRTQTRHEVESCMVTWLDQGASASATGYFDPPLGVSVLSFLPAEVVVVAPFIIVGPVDLPVVVRPFIGADDVVSLCVELLAGVLLPSLCAMAKVPERVSIRAKVIMMIFMGVTPRTNQSSKIRLCSVRGIGANELVVLAPLP